MLNNVIVSVSDTMVFIGYDCDIEMAESGME